MQYIYQFFKWGTLFRIYDMDFLSFLHNHHTFLVIFTIIFSAIIGSFLNVVIYRYPKILFAQWKQACQEYVNTPIEPEKLESLSWPGSHCQHCHKALTFWMLIPVLSYIFLRGKCHYCAKKISLQYPLVEILTVLCALFTLTHLGLSIKTPLIMFFSFSLIVLCFIDFTHKILPDTITLSVLWLGLLASTSNIFISPSSAIIGALSGYLSLWLIGQAYQLLRKKEGIGYGDYKMLAMIGAWTGAMALLNVILIAAFLALFIAGITFIFEKKRTLQKQIPFGPFLAVGAWLTLFYNQKITYILTQWLS